MAVKTKARSKSTGRTPFQACMVKSLKGKHYSSGAAARSALGKAAKACGRETSKAKR